MISNDLLGFVLKLNSISFALLILVFGFGSLLLVAIRTKSFNESILKSPGIMVGDIFLLPIAGFLITTFYQSIQNPLPILQSTWWNLLLIIAAVLASISAYRFKHLNIWWLPHNVFYFLMAYIVITFLAKGLIQLVFSKEEFNLWLSWILAMILISVHQLLGVVFPKRFPKLN